MSAVSLFIGLLPALLLVLALVQGRYPGELLADAIAGRGPPGALASM